MTPKQHFDVAIERAEHLLKLYDFVHDTRVRSVRKDWAGKLNQLMHWPKEEKIVRVDGKDGASLLILRPSTGVTGEKFKHNFASELLRSAVVAIVSALDRYMHDLVIYYSWTLLSRADVKIPKELRTLAIPLVATKHALQKLRASPKARPGVIVKEALRDYLHREYTFQRPDDVLRGAQMLSVTDFWNKVAAAMPGTPPKKDIMEKLRAVAQRRNQIVHEADFIRKAKAKKISIREIDRTTVEEWIAWMRDFVAAIDLVIEAAV